MRRGFSLVETLIALMILGVTLAAITGGIYTGQDAARRVDVLVTGRALAVSLMEQVIHRFHIRDNRYYRLETDPSDIMLRTQTGNVGLQVPPDATRPYTLDWQKPFLDLAQVRTCVLGAPAPATTVDTLIHGDPPVSGSFYFDPVNGPEMPPGLDTSDEKKFLASFFYEVRVSFQVTVNPGDAPVPIDANGDGVLERDMAKIEAEIFYKPPGSGPDRSVCRLSTLLVAQDRSPGVRLFSEM
jgi:prepilin-type N-terminal cleavage/methylation domain-containing protein